MIRIFREQQHGRSNLGWLLSRFHFSFADYHNTERMRFGALRVLNDDLVKPGAGFEMHPHRDMEIFTYVVDGELTHADSMGNSRTLGRGDVQYMSAGTGIFHSEHNRGTKMLRFLQIWIYPEKKNLPSAYGDERFPWDSRVNRLLLMAGPSGSGAPITIAQDARILASYIESGHELTLSVEQGRQVYLVNIEGELDISGELLHERDAAELTNESVVLTSTGGSHLLLVDMVAGK